MIRVVCKIRRESVVDKYLMRTELRPVKFPRVAVDIVYRDGDQDDGSEGREGHKDGDSCDRVGRKPRAAQSVKGGFLVVPARQSRASDNPNQAVFSGSQR